MLPGRMIARPQSAALVAACLAAASALAACGTLGRQLPQSSPYYKGAVIFNDHCSGCHTLDVAGAQGSATRVRDRERVDGPNFNVRKETKNQVLFAIRNGGFSGAIMPENIVTGPSAQAVAAFLARYSGLQAKRPPSPTG
jgi:mono/diheme cytochrome c family protein